MKFNTFYLIATLGMAYPISAMEMPQPGPAKPTPSAAEQTPTITLLSKDGQEFKVPLDIALQAGQLKDLMNISSHEHDTQNIELSFTNAVLQELKQLMWALYRHKDLSGKVLFDQLEKEVSIQNPFEILQIAHLLDAPMLIRIAVKFIAARLPEQQLTDTELADLEGKVITAVGPDKQVQTLQEIAHERKITLVSGEGNEFQVPLEIALQSGLVKTNYVLSGPKSPIAGVSPLTLSALSGQILHELAQLMWAIHENQNLQGKALLDTLKKEVPVKNLVELLKAADHLDIDILKQLFARGIIQDSQLRTQIKSLILSGEIAVDTANELARFCYLLTGYDLPGIDTTHITFSVQDYLDYLPRRLTIDAQGTLDLVGERLNSLAGLQNIPNRHTIRTLALINNHITSIPANAFACLPNLQNLFLSGNQISMIPTHAFAELHNLQGLSIGNNTITLIPAQAFAGLPNLRSIYLAGNQISTIHGEAFSGLPNLDHLDLSENQITEIPVQNLIELSNLDNLDLSHNRMTAIPAQAFAGQSNLNRLDLSHNQITAIPAQAFSGLLNMDNLSLNDNRITTIHTQAFAGLPNLANLNLFNNQIAEETQNELSAIYANIWGLNF